MKKIKMLEKMEKRLVAKALVFISISIIWVSCSKDETENYSFIPDVFQVNQVMEDDTVHALTYYVYANTEMSSASVARTNDLNNETALSPYLNSLFVMTYEPQDDDYKILQDTAGMFLFTITPKNGAAVQDSDYFNPQNLAVPEITDLSFSQQQNLVVEWDDVENADAFIVKVIDDEDATLYLSNGVNASTNELELISSHGTWSSQPANGETYTVQVHAILYEDGVNPVNASYNVEEVSIGRESIVWGQ